MSDDQQGMQPPGANGEIQATLSTVFREEAGKLVGALVRLLDNFEVAEEIVQDALLIALERWPVEGIPERPGAWLLTVARRRAIDQLRRDARYRDKISLLERTVVPESDDRLRLMFTCCHPAISRETQVILTLHAVCGFTTAQIAHTFLASESAIAKRLVRARQKIVQAGIPYRVPRAEELDERLGEVLTVLYLMFNEGYLASAGSAPMHRDLAEDAAWLAAFVRRLYPGEPEALGLLALMRLHLARADTRFDAKGKLILLSDQDRSRWDREMIANAVKLIEQAAVLGRPGPYQIQAALVACHAEAESWEATDWPQILALYDLLLSMTPSPVIRLNRAVALRYVAGLEVALSEVEALANDLAAYHLFHAIRGAFLLELGRREQARAAEMRALTLTGNQAEQSLLRQRLSERG
ncbi:DNA-directed RNA polymerase sigma-70 factor [Reticulibacter mediterranei]|uniref:RNA polymerase sigma factor n=1 Tax=Reticulibacter mediterranei TaxID=2778369 RepID=A0A8J3IEP5_9CHLR|nr:RNA polymerase sigma factor [Reticulibacter mediterranei]GHO92193.1 DNA-directed RNA polymerase sigma-70 factor [Reticulibacter mediterranei]